MSARGFRDVVLGNALVVAGAELAMMLGGMRLGRKLIAPLFDQVSGSPAFESFALDALSFAMFLVPIAILLVFMLVTNYRSLRVFATGGPGACARALAIGLLLGAALNAGISYLVGHQGFVQYEFQGFSLWLLALFPCSAIVCLCEEMLLRGFVPAYMEETHRWDAVALASGALFIFHHVGNLGMFGFHAVFCLNVFLMGVLLYLLVRALGNFWVAVGLHTAWNFTQQYLFGLPNSGIVSELALFKGTNEIDGLFFDTVYGNEGSLLTAAVLAALVLMLLVWNAVKDRRAEADVSASHMG